MDATKKLAIASNLKLDPMKMELAAIIGNPKFSLLGDCIKDSCLEGFPTIEGYLKACDASMNGDVTLPFDQKTLAVKVADLK